MNASGVSSSALTLFLRNRHLLILSVVVSIAAGLFGVSKLERFEDPRIRNIYPIIITPYPGASAERVETLVTEPLEDELAEVDLIFEMTSTSTSGVSVINIELDKSVNKQSYREVFAEIRDKIDNASAAFPDGVEPSIFDDKRDPAAFSMIVAVEWDMTSEPVLGILNRMAEDLADRLRSIDGTEMVRLYGVPDEEISVSVDHAELAAIGLTPSSLASIIRRNDSKTPAGTVLGPRSDLQIEVEGEIDSVERVRSIPVMESDDLSVIRVGDLSTVRRDWRDPPTEIGLVDGRRSVLVAARVGRQTAVDTWTREASTIVDDFALTAGEGVRIDTVFEQAQYTNARFKQLLGNMGLGIAIVSTVVFLMMGWRLGIVVGSAVPIVVSLTIFTFIFIGETLHQMSVYGMVIALGLLIDNAIVVADEVKKRKASGDSPHEAVVGAIRHLFLPLLASTLTTVLAFMPIVLLPGGPGDFVGAIGKSVSIAVSWSFLSAMTVTAALAGIFAKPTAKDQRSTLLRDGLGHPAVSRAYRGALRFGLRVPAATVALGLALPLLGFAIAPSLGQSFFPPADRDMFEVRVWMPTDSGVHATRQRAEAIEQEIRASDDITRVYWLVGGSFPRVYYNLPMDQDNSPHFAHAIVTTSSDRATKHVLSGLQDRIDERFPGAQVLVKQFRQGPPLVADVEYRLYGPSTDELIRIGDRIRRTLQADPEVVVAQATMNHGEPKLWFAPDEDEARVAGLSLGDIAQQLRGSLDGIVGGTMLDDLEEVPVRVRATSDRRDDITSLASNNLVRPGESGWIPLEALGEMKLEPELSSTTRFKGVRTNIIRGFTTIEALPINVAQRVLSTLDEEGYELPPGYRIELGGTVDQDVEVRADLMSPLPILVVLMAATLILAFRSVLLASLLGVVALMSVGMAILSTWLIDFPISFNTFMGTFGLIGVALNDSIVVVASIRGHRTGAAGDIDGIVEAVMDVTRHIISTTLTTVGGFMPLIVLVGGDFWPSMSIVLAGGIVGASIMSLLFIPAAYRMLRRWVAPRSPELHGVSEHPQTMTSQALGTA